MKIIGSLYLILLSQLIFSQSISSHMLNIDKYEKDAKIFEIIETTSHYNSSVITKDIEYKNFDTLMNLISLKRFNDENKLILLTINTYDSSNRKIRTDKKRWINTVGYQSGYSIYKYDSLFNFVQIDYNHQDQIQNIAKFYFNKDTNLVRLETYSGNEDLIGYETATYDYEKNQLTINQYNNQNKLINSKERSISNGAEYKQKPSNKYNEKGDLIYWESNWNKDDNICYTTDYKYDDRGSWISKKRYRYIKTENGKLKRKKVDMIKTREIKYTE